MIFWHFCGKRLKLLGKKVKCHRLNIRHYDEIAHYSVGQHHLVAKIFQHFLPILSIYRNPCVYYSPNTTTRCVDTED